MHEKADGPLRFRFLSQEHTAHVSKNRRVRQHGRDVHIATLKTGVGIVLRTTRLFILNSVILYHWCAWTGEGHRSRNWSWRPRGSPVTELELASARVTSHGTGAGEREGHQSRNWSWRTRGSPVTELELASARVTSHGTGAGEREGHQSRNWSWRTQTKLRNT